jgi:phosphatidylethanolamine N-methyltransferase
MNETMANPSSADAATESLRKRNTPIRAHSKEDARRAVLELNALEEKEVKDDKDRKTFGRTPGGTGKYSLDIVHTSLRR